MVFSSTLFLFVFLPVVLLLYYLVKPCFQNGILLLASLLFYAYGEPKFIFVMLLCAELPARTDHRPRKAPDTALASLLDGRRRMLQLGNFVSVQVSGVCG